MLVAVSGGSDSLALLEMCARARLNAVVVHLDHGWRPESAEDARFVAKSAAARGMRCLGERLTVAVATEAAGREARLTFFARAAAAEGAAGVLLGHTADDQAETLLLHLLRGTGTEGLTGMRAATTVQIGGRPLRLLRPLLDVRRRELRAYCLARGLVPREDPTNDDPRYLRNRVRHELLPLLSELQPRAIEALARAAELAGDQADLLEPHLMTAWAAVALDWEDPLMLDRAAFRSLDAPLQRALLRRAAARLLGPAHEVTLERVDAARVAVAARRGGTVIEWPGPLRIEIAGPHATFVRES